MSGIFVNAIIDRVGTLPGIMQGLAADRPAAGFAPNDWYLATDSQILYRWDIGTATWKIELSNGGAGGTPTLQNVTDNGNTTTDNIQLNNADLLFRAPNAFISGLQGPAVPGAARTWNLPDNSGTVALTSDIPGTSTLQAVTTAGNTSTNNIQLTNAALQFLKGFLNVLQSATTGAIRTWTLPDKSGTVAMTSDIPGAQNLQNVTDTGNITTDNIELNGSNLLFNQSFLNILQSAATAAIRTWTLPDLTGTIALVNYRVNDQSGGTYTLVLSDESAYVTCSIACTVTIPPNSSVAFRIGTSIPFEQKGAGKITFAAGAGVTINSKGGNLSTNGQFVVVSITKKGADLWTLYGDLTT